MNTPNATEDTACAGDPLPGSSEPADKPVATEFVRALADAVGPTAKLAILLQHPRGLRPLDAAVLAARLEMEDPRAYPSGTPIARTHRCRVRNAATVELCSGEFMWFLFDRSRRYVCAMDRAAPATSVYRVLAYHRQRIDGPFAARFDAVLRAYVDAFSAGGDLVRSVARRIRGTDREDANPRMIVAAAFECYLDGRDISTGEVGDPALFFVRCGRWHVGSRQAVAAAGISRTERTERERRQRGAATARLKADATARAAGRGIPEVDVCDRIDAADAVDAIRAIEAATSDIAQRAACHALLRDVPLTEAAALFGVPRQRARSGLARVTAAVRQAVAG